MDNGTKQEFIRRITQCNRSQLLLVTFDICLTYMEEAEQCCSREEWEGYRDALRDADHCVERLQDTLNFQYDISMQLYPLYSFCRGSLMQALYQRRTEGIEHAKRVLTQLQAAFEQAAGQDTSEPLMQNTQQIYAGMTYGKKQLNEDYREPDSRGFFA